ncbi:hypothetical protein PC121_g10895 [Phytophthora cactorum]|nr:hypothetical protein PC120_g8746 [Phytophthora cactorum]KAG3066359.1 hypothetical protein PC121_g10895 [Phytophthora cactorum]
MHVIACVRDIGLVYYDTKFGSNRHANTNDFIRSLLRTISDEPELTLADGVLVLDNAPCHCRAESVFEETEFLGAKLLRLGPYSPMLNPIENVFSSFKALVKAFMRESRRDILIVPEGVTMKDHRQAFLHTAANHYLPQVTTAANCCQLLPTAANCCQLPQILPAHAPLPCHGQYLENMPVGT